MYKALYCTLSQLHILLCFVAFYDHSCYAFCLQIFYPDLIDKTKTPEYTVVSVGSSLLRFPLLLYLCCSLYGHKQWKICSDEIHSLQFM